MTKDGSVSQQKLEHDLFLHRNAPDQDSDSTPIPRPDLEDTGRVVVQGLNKFPTLTRLLPLLPHREGAACQPILRCLHVNIALTLLCSRLTVHDEEPN